MIFRVHFQNGIPMGQGFGEKQIQALVSEHRKQTVILKPGEYDLTPERSVKEGARYHLIVFDNGRAFFDVVFDDGGKKEIEIVADEKDELYENLKRNAEKGVAEISIPEQKTYILITGDHPQTGQPLIIDIIYYAHLLGEKRNPVRTH